MTTQLKFSSIYALTRQQQRGFSIVEILVALVLSLILTLVVSQIYLGSKQSYRLQEAQSRLQENGRFALELLAKDIRRAGNLGCPPAKKTAVVIAKSSPDILPSTAILGYNANTPITSYPFDGSDFSSDNWTPNLPYDSLNAMDGRDIFSIQFAEPCGGRLQAKLTQFTPTPSIIIPSTNTCSIQPASDVLVISDCGQAEVFRADAVSSDKTTITLSGTTNNTQSNFFYDHNLDAEVMVFHSHTYFIRVFNSEPTLYRQDNTEKTPTPQPIMEGFEDMQVLYGIDANPIDGSVDRYLSADNVNGLWINVIAVRIDLVLRSTGTEGDNLTIAPLPTTACNGIEVKDHRLRRCYSFTINLRNPRT